MPMRIYPPSNPIWATNIPMPPIQGRVSITSDQLRRQRPQLQRLARRGGRHLCWHGRRLGLRQIDAAEILPRFYEPESGCIDRWTRHQQGGAVFLRRQIGVVPQDSLLFDGTIKDNLLMVKPDATSQELIRAAEIACAHDFIVAARGLQPP